jgi:hypothetical protein
MDSAPGVRSLDAEVRFLPGTPDDRYRGIHHIITRILPPHWRSDRLRTRYDGSKMSNHSIDCAYCGVDERSSQKHDPRCPKLHLHGSNGLPLPATAAGHYIRYWEGLQEFERQRRDCRQREELRYTMRSNGKEKVFSILKEMGWL